MIEMRRTLMTSCLRQQNWSSATVRQTYIDYFTQRQHKFVRSSPVLPRNDKSLAFVNAGMNQFKSILTGDQLAPWSCAVNSQKCVRVGGKHNDLSDVGTDGYHHTYFEMLGSWSFGDYFKREACSLAWQLLTGVYGLDPRHLYVTYYRGDSRLGIPADTETRDIWRALGVRGDHIISFGGENLWEMGAAGPCGPCTEIHYDRLQRTDCVGERVNRGHADVTELWNVVFMQYLREEDGSIERLPQHHVDTGMGLERLCAVLQRVADNYGTDLFSPLFSTIHQLTSVDGYGGRYGSSDVHGLDTAQRILVDHARMAAVCLTDGVLPHNNYKLRKVLRRLFRISESQFQCAELPAALCSRVAQLLCPAYPELELRAEYVQMMISAERDSWLSSVDSAAAAVRRWGAELPELRALTTGDGGAALVAGLRQLRLWLPPDGAAVAITGQMAFKLHQEYGFTEEILLDVASARGLQFDPADLDLRLTQLQKDSQRSASATASAPVSGRQVGAAPPTEDAGRYCKWAGRAEGGLLSVWDGRGCAVDSLQSGDSCTVLLDRTVFYPASGGQQGDRGTVQFTCGDVRLHVLDTQYTSDRRHVLHVCRVDVGGAVRPGARVQCSVDRVHREGCALHHTAAHLLNAAVIRLLPSAVQTGCSVSAHQFRLDISTVHQHEQLVSECERLVQQWIDADLPVLCEPRVPWDQLVRGTDSGTPVSLLSGVVYPDQCRVVHVPNVSVEPCCGTHVPRTGVLRRFRVVSLKTAGHRSKSLRAVTGEAALRADIDGAAALQAMRDLSSGAIALIEAQRLAAAAPYTEKSTLLRAIEEAAGASRSSKKTTLMQKIESDMCAMERESGAGCIVYSVSERLRHGLSVGRLLKHRRVPTVIVYRIQDHVHVRCWINQPQDMSAVDWLSGAAGDRPYSDNAAGRRQAAGFDIPCSYREQPQLVEALVERLRSRATQLQASAEQYITTSS